MRIIRILVVLLIAHAAITLVTPATFIDWKSWVIFGVVFICMLVPEVESRKSKVESRKNKATELIGHPILLILAAGLAGLLLY